MLEYPKIETLYERDKKTHKVIPELVRMPEVALVKSWLVTEKVDGTNIRVHLKPDGSVEYGGRTADAQLYAPLVDYLHKTLPAENVAAAFEPGMEVVLFGEGYGPKIQKGGGLYRNDVAFRLFDVVIVSWPNTGGPPKHWWLNWADVIDVATKLGIQPVPTLRIEATLEEAVQQIETPSTVAFQDGGFRVQEGIVARTDPLLFTRKGQRVMFKLKGKDF